ncbi:hypothetical protein Hanom_Chr16g01445861 [Helianthus anomalus]
MFVPNFRCCSLPLKLMSFVLNVSKSCTVCPLSLTQFIFLLNIFMCLAHEDILVILVPYRLMCKHLMLRD